MPAPGTTAPLHSGGGPAYRSRPLAVAPRRSRVRRTMRRAAGSLSAGTILLLLAAVAHAAAAAPFRLRDLDRHIVELDQLRHRGPVVLEFWATWCAPCRAVFPELELLRRTYLECGVTVVGVSVDGPRNAAKVRPFVARERITFPVVLDLDGRLQQLYQVSQLPTAILIDTTGNVVASRVGFRPGETLLRDRIVALCGHGHAAADSAARQP